MHEDIYDLEKETKLPVRLVFIGLWCAADREGWFKWSPRQLKAQILPYDEIDFSRVLDALTTRGFVDKYTSETVSYGHISSFSKHQFVNPKEKASDIAKTIETMSFTRVAHASLTRDSREPDAFLREGKGKEGNNKGTVVELGTKARILLHYLNEKSGRHFRETDSNLSFIIQRLGEFGVDLDGVKLMIDRQCARWKHDPKMSEYLRPETLFNRTKFDSYYSAKELPPEPNGKAKVPELLNSFGQPMPPMV